LFRYHFSFYLFASVVLVYSASVSVSICFTSVLVVCFHCFVCRLLSRRRAHRVCFVASVVYSHAHAGTHVFPVVDGVGGAAGLLHSDGGFDSVVMVRGCCGCHYCGCCCDGGMAWFKGVFPTGFGVWACLLRSMG
jgi:hypothetical protein